MIRKTTITRFVLLIYFLSLVSCSTDDIIDIEHVMPNKAAFFGNSLLSGFGNYGMAASQSDKDYYHLITNYLSNSNAFFTSTKNKGTAFEALTNAENIDSIIQSVFLDNLEGDENLIIIQLGDNVNTIEKKLVFEESSLKLCQAIKIKCPSAKVIWMGLWYGSEEKYEAIQNACIKTGSIFISFEDIVSNGTKNKIGKLTKKGDDIRTLENVLSVVNNNDNNITVIFKVGSITYSSTLEIYSYSLDMGVLIYYSEYEIINSPFVESHPNDEGFRLIANRFLYKMELYDNNEYYR